MAVVEARIATYAGLRKALIARRRALGLSQEAANDMAGLAGGYINKLEVGLKNYGNASLDGVLRALSVEIVLLPAVARIRPRAKRSLGAASVSDSVTENSFGKIMLTAQQLGGRARAQKLSPEKRVKLARRAALVRWKGHFAKKKLAAQAAELKAAAQKPRPPIDGDRAGKEASRALA